MVEEGSTRLNSAAEDRVQDILQSLPVRYREVLIYRFLLHLSVRETALSMGVTETNVKVIQFRGENGSRHACFVSFPRPALFLFPA